ncbi:aspartyl-phosphate phosphatase Spo0E family protein [Cuneatibacter sp. NSJ-177]|nr:aspartyl-phosphate phosphatase Spo0E family protein [Cuneatibacter sp. NSJ-177]MCJ7835947.1 aspartyl-phosphate phosphatase Spo0E family protein [Cuneatibacter sp. NSJ-177]
MYRREELRQKIEDKRKELSETIDQGGSGDDLYRLSVELDQLIALYMEE